MRLQLIQRTIERRIFPKVIKKTICFGIKRTNSSMSNQKSSKMNLVTAINDALRISLQTDPSAIIFGEGKNI